MQSSLASTPRHLPPSETKRSAGRAQQPRTTGRTTHRTACRPGAQEPAGEARNWQGTVENEGQGSVVSFGTLLRRHRLGLGLSQEALAERARMSTDGISALERGYRRTPQRTTLSLLASALDLNEEQGRAFEAAAARWELLRRQGEASVTIGPWPSAAGTALPLALTSFVGREVELEEILSLVGDHRLVTVTGPGGIGKTQTALQVGTALVAATQGPVCFAALAQVADPSLVVTEIASSLGVQEVPNHLLLETLWAYLKNKTMLLILDNCEHVVASVRTVAKALLLNCPHVRILATSREPLRCAGEQSYRLPSLSVPWPEAARAIGAAESREYAAVALFIDRARAVDHRFRLTDENAPSVAELCRGLDGIPLAIELAAARVNVLTVRALLGRLNDRFRILGGNEQDDLPRQQTMRATIDWSYELLSDREQRTFERLSVFGGGCTLAAAAAICTDTNASEADVLELLSSLADKSLVIADLDGRAPRYRLLESFREYACEKLAMRGETDVVAQRHALVCLELAEQLERAFNSEADTVWQALVREELSNWRAVLHWALTERGDVLLGQRLVGRLTVVWQYFARVEGRRWIALALELVDELTPASVLAVLEYCEATVAMLLREYHRQLTCATSASARYLTVGDSLSAARAQDVASLALFLLGRVREAGALAQEVLARARSAGDRRLVALALRTLSSVCASTGDLAKARQYVAEALQIYGVLGATHDASSALNDLAYVESCAGNAELALRHSADALARCRDTDDLSATMDARDALTKNLIWLGRYDPAEERAREMLGIARERHEDVYAAFALQHLGSIIALRPHVAAQARLHAARVLGFSEARIAAMGSARALDYQWVYDRTVAALCDAMGAAAFEKLVAEGAAMTEEQAVDEALTALDDPCALRP
jgi:predicted ATPase/transcriptional regulator with XRE-family HTH domain